MSFDYEELILERQEMEYEDPAPDYVMVRWFCPYVFHYMDCDKCERKCDWRRKEWK